MILCDHRDFNASEHNYCPGCGELNLRVIEFDKRIAQLQARLESEEAHYARLVEQGKERVDIADIPKLKEFLLAQEKNIAWWQEAYGEIEPLFNAVFGRRPNDEG